MILASVSATNVAAEGFTVGFSGMIGMVTADGTEHERTDVGDSQKTNHSTGDTFVGGDIFAEYEFANGYAFGVSAVPFDADIGSGKRTDTVGTADAGQETGDRSASAKLTNLYTIYATKSVGSGGTYLLAGFHDGNIEITETLPNSTYADQGVNGIQLGIGHKIETGSGALRYELSYSDFDDIDVKSSTGATGQKVTADADAVYVKIGYSF